MNLFTRVVIVSSLALSVSACGMFGGNNGDRGIAPKTTALGVNGYLWQATVDVLSFMSIASADARSGMIITEWYTDPNVADERVKVTVQFLTEDLRSDGIKVTPVRQRRENNTWITLPVKAATGIQVQNSILDQARQIKLKSDNK